MCSGESSQWIDPSTNDVPKCPSSGRISGEVCQDELKGASGLLFNEVDAPFEFMCKVNIERGNHYHTIQFLSDDTGS